MAGEVIPNPAGLEFPLRVVPPKPRGSGRVWYKPNHRSFGAFIKSEQMRDVTEEVAKDVAMAATSGAPAPSEKTPASHAAPVYTVKREAGLFKVGGNLRVKVEVIGKGSAAERAEFGLNGGDGRHRNLARAGSHYGDWKPVD